MSRYTPKLRPAGAGGGPARPKRSGPPRHKPGKKTGKSGAFPCDQCDKRFNTEEARATHAAAAHGTPIDAATMTPVAENMARCEICGATMRKRNLERHVRFIHDSE